MRRKIHLLGFAVAVSFFLPASVLAVGIAPAETIVTDLLQNSVVERELLFSRGNPESDDAVTVTFEGDAASAIVGAEGNEIVLPQGEQIVTYPIEINAGSLPTGDYAVNVIVNPVPPPQDDVQNGQSILTGAKGQILFSVTTEEIEELSIKELLINDTESDQPISFRLRALNEGNVASKPARIELEFVDRNDAQLEYVVEVDASQVDFVEPFLESTLQYETDTLLPEGVYTVNMTVYDSKDTVLYSISPDSEERSDIRVFPPGTLARSGELVDLFTDKAEYEVGEIAQVTGVFKNTGEIDVNATLSADLLLDGNRIEILVSEPRFVAKGTQEELTLDVRVSDGGDYTTSATVDYGFRETDVREATFTVQSLNPNIVLAVLACVAVLCVLAVLLFQRQKREEQG
jgi:hypothetical protein